MFLLYLAFAESLQKDVNHALGQSARTVSYPLAVEDSTQYIKILYASIYIYIL